MLIGLWTLRVGVFVNAHAGGNAVLGPDGLKDFRRVRWCGWFGIVTGPVPPTVIRRSAGRSAGRVGSASSGPNAQHPPAHNGVGDLGFRL